MQFDNNSNTYILNDLDCEALGLEQLPLALPRETLLQVIASARRELQDVTPTSITDADDRFEFVAAVHGWLARLNDMEDTIIGYEPDTHIAQDAEAFLREQASGEANDT